jgi:nitrate reductase NapD
MTTTFIPLHDLSLPSSEQLHIASLVAYLRPEESATVHDWILQTHNNIRAEIHVDDIQGKLVIVTESNDEKSIADFLTQLRDQPGVLSVALVYHEYLSTEDLLEELPIEAP